ncbi:MAG TPA: carboxypeptidase regulatory-like domain-containing protein [Thermoanaerobaculia bacterium]
MTAAGAGAATVSGTVSSGGRALSGMVVAAYDPSGALRATASTDPTGLYVLNLPAGDYRLLAYDPAGVYATLFDGNAESFETTPVRTIGAAGAQVSFALVKGGTVSGQVTIAGGSPGGGAVVEVYNLSGTRRAFATADASGNFSIVVPPGQYKVIAYDPGGTYAQSFYSNARSFAEATPLQVFESVNTAIVLNLGLAARVSGIAVDAATGARLASIGIYAYTPGGALVASTITDSSGAFALALPAGDYRFVGADPARTYATSFYDRGIAFESSTVVSLAAGAQRANVQLALARGARISGHVNSANLTVAAYNLDGTLHASTTSDANGNYTLLVAPGEYRIAVSDPFLTYATLFYGGTPTFAAAQRLFVSGDVGGIDVTLPRGGRVSGTLRDPSRSTPLAGMTVAAYDAAGLLVATATSGADGRYLLVLAPGAYRLLAFDPQLVYATSYAGGATSYETTASLSIAFDTLVTADFAMQRGVRVSGTVRIGALAAPAGVEVFALDATGNRVAATTVGANGAFTLVVPPGTYRFVAADPQRRYVAGAPTAAITVVSGQNVPPQSLTLESVAKRRSVRH